MELTVALCISILGCVISVASFILNRKDKAVTQEAEEQKQFSKHDLIEYRLNELTKKVDKVLDKLDTFDKEIDEKINKALEQHVLTYHK